MRLATFEVCDREAWGFVLRNPNDDRDWVFDTWKVADVLKQSCRLGSSGWHSMMPHFWEADWGDELAAFLREGDEGMRRLREMAAYAERFLRESDAYLMEQAGYPVADVHLRAPIPRPRIMFGLVQNSPSFWRHNPVRRSINLYPMGHQRPIGSVVGQGEIFLQPEGFNVEVGYVIGKGGRDIPIGEAASHIAGYTVVIDSQINDYYTDFLPEWTKGRNIEADLDWFVAATCSWCGKKSDAHCVMGPWLTTSDEVGNPYDLLVYTLQDGKLRDRSHTAGTSLGVEYVVHWMSSFMELQPGDVIHLGTVGTDGLPTVPGMRYDRHNTVGSEIEHVGRVEAVPLDLRVNDWRTEEEKHPNADLDPEDEAIRDSVVPAVRDVLKRGEASVDSFDIAKTRHVWTLYGNYEAAEELEGMRKTAVPRFLNGPASQAARADTVTLAKRATSLDAGVEMAFVISRLASHVKEEDAKKYILGYAPVISVADHSFEDRVVEPATMQERHLPKVYARWGDGYQVIGEFTPEEPDWNAAVCADAGEYGAIRGSLREYVHRPEKIVETITKHITLFPGDVILMGRLGERIQIPAGHPDGITVRGQVEGFPEQCVRILRKG